MFVYYVLTPAAPGRHRIVLANWDADDERFDRTTLGPDIRWHRFDELRASLPELATLKASLVPAPPPAGPPPPPPRWRYVSTPSPALERPDLTIWHPPADPERQALFTVLPSGPGMGSRLEQIRDNANTFNLAQIQASLRDLAVVNLRILRRLRQRDGGQPGD